MDETDRRILLLVGEDPRISVLELAKKLGLSRQATHHRMQVFEKMGVFKKIKAEISFRYLDIVLVSIWGISRTRSATEILDRLGENDCTVHVSIGGGNEVAVLGGLREIADLGSYLEFVKRAAEMPEPTVGIPNFGDGINPDWMDGGRRRREYKPPSLLGYRIVMSLREDARKPAAKIAKEVGASARTVRRCIQRMRSDGILDFHEVGDLTDTDSTTVAYLTLRNGSDKVKVAKRLLSIDPVRLYARSYSNLANILSVAISSDKISETRDLLERIRNDPDVLSVIPNLIYLERDYITWDVKDSADKVKAQEMRQ